MDPSQGEKYVPFPFRRHFHKGRSWPNIILASSIDAMETFEVRPDDIWVVTYPKSGTHWMAEIVGLILADGYPEKIDRTTFQAAIEMISNVTQRYPQTKEEEERIPIDTSPFLEKIEKVRSPRIILTHLERSLLPPKLEERARILYVARNPKDMLNSLYNFKGKLLMPWEKMFQSFIMDAQPMGSWYDHVTAFWKLRDEKNVRFMFYEEMKKDPKKHIKVVAELLGRPLTDEALQRIDENSSFKGMKKTYDKAAEDSAKTGKHDFTKAPGEQSFMGKGVCGQWKNRFTVAQNEAFDKWYQNKMANTDLRFSFE